MTEKVCGRCGSERVRQRKDRPHLWRCQDCEHARQLARYELVRAHMAKLPARRACAGCGKSRKMSSYVINEQTGQPGALCRTCRSIQRAEQKEHDILPERDEQQAAAFLARRGEWAQMPHDDASALMVVPVEWFEERGVRKFRAKVV